MAQASPLFFVICRTVCSQSAIRLAVTMTFAPSAPNRSAIALPMPLLLLLPVTIATLLFNRCMHLPFLYTSLQGSGQGCPLLRATFSPTPERAETRSCPSRAQFHRARSASKKGTWPLPIPSFQARLLLVVAGGPIGLLLRASGKFPYAR